MHACTTYNVLLAGVTWAEEVRHYQYNQRIEKKWCWWLCAFTILHLWSNILCSVAARENTHSGRCSFRFASLPSSSPPGEQSRRDSFRFFYPEKVFFSLFSPHKIHSRWLAVCMYVICVFYGVVQTTMTRCVALSQWRPRKRSKFGESGGVWFGWARVIRDDHICRKINIYYITWQWTP